MAQALTTLARWVAGVLLALGATRFVAERAGAVLAAVRGRASAQ